MRKVLFVLATVGMTGPLAAQAPRLEDALLERIVGDWVLEGTIGGNQVTHDIEAAWVLEHLYVRLHEVSREREANGRPVYEAIVFIGRDPHSDGYAAMWLDTTGGEGLNGDGIGHAPVAGDSIPFVFHFPSGEPFYTTFAYDRTSDTWRWQMDGEAADGTRRPFARVTLTRK